MMVMVGKYDYDDCLTKKYLISFDDSPFGNLKGYMEHGVLPCRYDNVIMAEWWVKGDNGQCNRTGESKMIWKTYTCKVLMKVLN